MLQKLILVYSKHYSMVKAMFLKMLPETAVMIIIDGSPDGPLHQMRAHGQRGSIARFSIIVDDHLRNGHGRAAAAAGAPAFVVAAAADVDLQHFGVVVFQVVQVDAVLIVLENDIAFSEIS
jgi:hypothetical protein